MGDEKFTALRLLINAATEREDLSALAAIAGKPELDAVFTNLRKAIAEIDCAFSGPQ